MINEIAILAQQEKWVVGFQNIFPPKNIRLILYDEDLRSLRRFTNATIAESIDDCVKSADMVLVCVPIKNTPLTVKECAKKNEVWFRISRNIICKTQYYQNT